jgi:hypothetical protein
VWIRGTIRNQGNHTSTVGIINITAINISMDGGLLNATSLSPPNSQNSTIILEFQDFINLTAANISPSLSLSRSNTFGRITLYGLNFTSIPLHNQSIWNISNNLAFVNTTLQGRMNITGQIRIDDHQRPHPEPQVDYADNGGFRSCNSNTTANCTVLLNTSTTLLFNTTHFTSYQAEEIGIYPCDTGNENATCIITSTKFLNGFADSWRGTRRLPLVRQLGTSTERDFLLARD